MGSQPAPLGQDPLPAQHPQQGLGSGWAVQGKAPCQRFLRQAPGAQLPWPGSSATDVSEGEVRNPSRSPFATSMAFLDVVGLLPLLLSARSYPWAPHFLLVIGRGWLIESPPFSILRLHLGSFSEVQFVQLNVEMFLHNPGSFQEADV